MPMKNDERTAWNAENYTQVKIYAEKELAAAFKAACAADGVSIAAVLSQAMSDYCSRQQDRKKVPKQAAPDYSTRGKRRAATQRIVGQLEEIRDAEEAYKDNIPENLQGAMPYESAEQTVAALDEALDALVGAFQ